MNRDSIKGLKSNSSGFAVASAIGAMLLIGIATAVMMSSTQNANRAQSAINNRAALSSAINALTVSIARDAELGEDGIIRAKLALKTNLFQDGGLIRPEHGSQTSPSGSAYKLCVWHNGPNPGNPINPDDVEPIYVNTEAQSYLGIEAAPSTAIIEAGKDGVVQTSCASLTRVDEGSSYTQLKTKDEIQRDLQSAGIDDRVFATNITDETDRQAESMVNLLSGLSTCPWETHKLVYMPSQGGGAEFECVKEQDPTVAGTNLGTGAGVYAGVIEDINEPGIHKEDPVKQLQFKSIVGQGPIQVTDNGSEIVIDSSGAAASATNIGGGFQVYSQGTSAPFQMRTLRAGANVFMSYVGDEIEISAAPGGGGTIVGGRNVGAGDGQIYAGTSGNQIDFRTLRSVDSNLEITTNGNEVLIRNASPANGLGGVNIGGIDAGLPDDLTNKGIFAGIVNGVSQFKRLQAGAGVVLDDGSASPDGKKGIRIALDPNGGVFAPIPPTCNPLTHKLIWNNTVPNNTDPDAGMNKWSCVPDQTGGGGSNNITVAHTGGGVALAPQNGQTNALTLKRISGAGAVTVTESGGGIVINGTGTTGGVTDAANVGGGASIFRDKTGSTLNFRTIMAGTGITAVPNGNVITLSAPGANLWTLSGSNIHYNAGNVGIGTNAPTEKLHIVGNAFLTGRLLTTGDLATQGNYLVARDAAGGNADKIDIKHDKLRVLQAGGEKISLSNEGTIQVNNPSGTGLRFGSNWGMHGAGDFLIGRHTANNTPPTSLLRITGAGDTVIGSGVAVPDFAKLAVHGTITSTYATGFRILEGNEDFRIRSGDGFSEPDNTLQFWNITRNGTAPGYANIHAGKVIGETGLYSRSHTFTPTGGPLKTIQPAIITRQSGDVWQDPLSGISGVPVKDDKVLFAFVDDSQGVGIPDLHMGIAGDHIVAYNGFITKHNGVFITHFSSPTADSYNRGMKLFTDNSNSGSNRAFGVVIDPKRDAANTPLDSTRFHIMKTKDANARDFREVNSVREHADLQAKDIYYVALQQTSDGRLKTGIEALVDSLDKVLALRGVSYQWKDGTEEAGAEGSLRKTHIGLIAQEVEKIFPFLVDTDKITGKKTVNYVGLIAPLIESVKTLKAENEMLKAQLAQQAAMMQSMESRLANLEQAQHKQAKLVKAEAK